MKKNCYILWILLVYFAYAPLYAQNSKEVTAKMILGNPKYQGICYGGYRKNTRDIEPTVSEVKEDLKILAAFKPRMSSKSDKFLLERLIFRSLCYTWQRYRIVARIQFSSSSRVS